MLGQTVPPVSVARTRIQGLDKLPLEATKVMLDSSQMLGDLILPGVNVYDMINSANLSTLPLIAYFSTLLLYLTFAVVATNRREFFYGTN